jgi:hypothetical protein
MGKYDDILHLSYPFPSTRPRMNSTDRAAQFSPFAALTGFEAVIEESGRLTETAIELEESAKAELDQSLRQLSEQIHTHPKATITYFASDPRKLGGAYLTVTGNVKKIDTYEMRLILTDDTGIPISAIVQIYL